MALNKGGPRNFNPKTYYNEEDEKKKKSKPALNTGRKWNSLEGVTQSPYVRSKMSTANSPTKPGYSSTKKNYQTYSTPKKPLTVVEIERNRRQQASSWANEKRKSSPLAKVMSENVYKPLSRGYLQEKIDNRIGKTDVTGIANTKGYQFVFGNNKDGFNKKLEQKQDQKFKGSSYTPSKGFLGRMVQGGAELVGQMGASALSEETLAGALGGTLIARNPMGGAKIGMALRGYHTGAGSIYRGMKDRGVDEKKAKTIASIGAIPYSALEYAQLGSLTKGLGKGASKVGSSVVAKYGDDVFRAIAKSMPKVARSKVLPFAQNYVRNVGEQVLEEVAQEGVSIGAENIGLKSSGKTTDKWSDVGKRLVDTAKSSAPSFMLMGLPGSIATAKSQTVGISDNLNSPVGADFGKSLNQANENMANSKKTRRKKGVNAKGNVLPVDNNNSLNTANSLPNANDFVSDTNGQTIGLDDVEINKQVNAQKRNKKAKNKAVNKKIVAPEVLPFSFDSADDYTKNRANAISDFMGKIGANFEFIDTDERINGLYKDGKISVNVRSNSPLGYVLGHELSHDISSKAKVNGDYSVLNDLLHYVIHSSGKVTNADVSLQNAIQNKMREYGAMGVNVTPAMAKDELVADAIGKAFSSDKAMERLGRYNANLLSRLYDSFSMWKDGAFGSADDKATATIQKKFINAMRNVYRTVDWNAEQNIQSDVSDKSADSPMYSFVGTDSNGIRHYESDYKGLKTEDRFALFQKTFKNMFNGANVDIDDGSGNIVNVIADRHSRRKNLYTGNTALRTMYMSDWADILKNAKFIQRNPEPSHNSNVPPKNEAHKNVVAWDIYKATVMLDGNEVEVTFSIARKKSGVNRMYYIGLQNKTVGNITNSPQNASAKSNIPTASGNSIQPNILPVNTNPQNNYTANSTNTTPSTQNTTAPTSQNNSQSGTGINGATPSLNSDGISYDDTPVVREPLLSDYGDKVRQFAKSAFDSEIFNEQDKLAMMNKFASDPSYFIYHSTTNASSENNANAEIDRVGEDTAYEHLRGIVTSGGMFKPKDTAMAISLMKRLSAQGKSDMVANLVADMSVMATEMGQNTQYLKTIKQFTPEGRLLFAQRSIDRLNAGRNIDNMIALTDNDKADILSSDDDTAGSTVKRILAKKLAEQNKTALDMWNSWRYLAMLGNPRTHIRNFVGNLAFSLPVKLSDGVSTAIQTALLDKEKRNKSFSLASRDDRLVAGAFLKSVEIGNKENTADKTPFGNSAFATPLNALSNFNSNLLEAGDRLFMGKYFSDYFVGYLATKGIKVSELASFSTDLDGKKTARLKQLSENVQATVDEAINFAVQQAKRNTFRDYSKLASSISRLSKNNKGASVIIEGLLPFKSTPINILKRGIEYSPVGTLNTGKMIAENVVAKIKGIENKHSTVDIIDTFSRGATGSTALILGMVLSNMGVVVGRGDDEEYPLDSTEGVGAYSLFDGEKYYSLDWLAPISLPFFSGVELNEAMTEKGFEVGDMTGRFVDALTSMSEPMIEMSMLQGINDAIKSARYAEGNALGEFAGGILGSYVSQGVPTMLGQIARTMDDRRRTSMVDYKSSVPVSLQKVLNKNIAKIPVLNQKAPAFVDPFGRYEFTGNALQKGVQNFILPYYVKTNRADSTSSGLRSLYDSFGEVSVLPKKAVKKVDGMERNFTKEEYENFNTARGQLSHKLLSELMNDSGYNNMSDEDKAKVIGRAYEYSSAITKHEILGNELDTKYANMKKLLDVGMNFSSISTMQDKEDLYSQVKKSSNRGVAFAEINRWGELPLQGKEREDFILSTMSKTAQTKYKYMYERGVADIDTYYVVYSIVTGSSNKDEGIEYKKEHKIADLVSLGFSESQAYRLYSVIQAKKKYL